MMDLPNTEKEEIIKLCERYHVKKIVLFGSRARGGNTALSDIDIAVSGADDFDGLYADLKYNDFTLLDIDIINLDDKLSRELLSDIAQEGITIYERCGTYES